MSAERRCINAERRSGTPGSNTSAATWAVRQLFFFLILHSAFIILTSAPLVRADPPTTQPTTRPAAGFPADSPYRGWFKKLADVDPRVREQAQFELMGMSDDDLPEFRQLIESSRPLAPAQVVALHDIVEQVYLSGQKYYAVGGQTDASGKGATFVLGIRAFNNEILQFNMGGGVSPSQRFGLPVETREPGMPAFRFLHDGDMILSVRSARTDSVFQPPQFEIHALSDLRNVIAPENGPPLQKVVLGVLRDGEQISVTMQLAPKPVTMDDTEAFTAPRVRQAESYWAETFEPLLDRPIAIESD